MKIPRSHFVRFKKAFLKWQDKLSVRGYRIDFCFVPLQSAYADISIDEDNKIATIQYASKIGKKNDKFDTHSPENTARHEALHLLLHRLYWLGQQRWVGSSEAGQEWEHLVRVLEKIL